MKNAFSKWYSYVFAFLLIVLAESIAVIPYLIIQDNEVWPLVYISFISLFAAVVYIGGGFIAQDIYRAIQRKKTNNWDFPLEDKHINMAWRIYLPFLLSGTILLFFGLISYLFFR